MNRYIIHIDYRSRLRESTTMWEQPFNKPFKYFRVCVFFVYFAIQDTVDRRCRQDLYSLAAMEPLFTNWSCASWAVYIRWHTNAAIGTTFVYDNDGVDGVSRSPLEEVVYQIVVTFFGNILRFVTGSSTAFNLSTDGPSVNIQVEGCLEEVGHGLLIHWSYVIHRL